MKSSGGLPGFDDLLWGDQIAGARPYQEDTFMMTGFRGGDPDGCDLLMVLADGMGGHRGGAKASELAVETFVETFLSATGGVAARLRLSLDAANSAVGEYAADNSRYRGMGCTLVGCVVTGSQVVHWISVGDSPLWRVHADEDDDVGEMERLNADHSMRPVLDDLVRLGRITAEEAMAGPVHQLRSAVMGKELALVDEGEASARLGTGDRIVLASDGLETLAEEEIQVLCEGDRTAATIVADLLDAVEAKADPWQDNASVVVYKHLTAQALQRRFGQLTARTRQIVRS